MFKERKRCKNVITHYNKGWSYRYRIVGNGATVNIISNFYQKMTTIFEIVSGADLVLYKFWNIMKVIATIIHKIILRYEARFENFSLKKLARSYFEKLFEPIQSWLNPFSLLRSSPIPSKTLKSGNNQTTSIRLERWRLDLVKTGVTRSESEQQLIIHCARHWLFQLVWPV